MNKDLEVFENRFDDWLAKERAYENSVSAWDLDEGKKIKEYHEDHCEAEYIKETHAKAHQYYNEKTKERLSKNTSQYQELKGKTFASSITVVVFALAFIGMIADTAGVNVNVFGFLFPLIIFIVVLSTLLNIKRRK